MTVDLYSLGHSLTRRLVGLLSDSEVRRLEDGQATDADMRAAARMLREAGEGLGADLVLWVLEDAQAETSLEVASPGPALGALNDVVGMFKDEGSNHHG